MRHIIGPMLAVVFTACLPGHSPAQLTTLTDVPPRWEVTLDGHLGFPTGYIRVSETVTHGSRLRLRDLGVDVSESIDVGAAFWITPRDAVRGSYLYDFLRGGSTLDRAVLYDGREYAPGHVDTNADFWRVSLAYERVLTTLLDGGRLIGSAGLTYVWLNAGLTQNGKTKSEDFYLQEMPVPIVGLRFDMPLTSRLGLRASVAGGLLPKVDSLRKEGGTVYTWQSHADANLTAVYAISNALALEGGYQFTYFHQHEKSHEDNNVFDLIDSGLRVRLTLRF